MLYLEWDGRGREEVGTGLQFSSNYIRSDGGFIRRNFADTSRGATFRRKCTDARVALCTYTTRCYSQYSYSTDISLSSRILAQLSLGTEGLVTLLPATAQLRVRHTEPCVRGVTHGILLTTHIRSGSLQSLLWVWLHYLQPFTDISMSYRCVSWKSCPVVIPTGKGVAGFSPSETLSLRCRSFEQSET